MEYCNNTFKMIIHMGLFLIFTQTIHCYPHPERFHLPKIPVLSAEEVNSLEQSHPIQRSIIPTLSNPNNIDSTIKEVEAILSANPALPRLTRGEILDILENITNVDATISHPGNRDPKAIMVVMPFTPSNADNQNIEDLYTKSPVTHIIDAEPFKTNPDEKKTKHNRRRPAVTYAGSEEIAKKPAGNDERKKYETPTSTAPPRSPVRRRRPVVTTVKPEVVRNEPVTTYRPRMTTTYRPRQEISSTYRSTRRPIRRRTTTIEPEVITYRNHRYSDEKPKFVPSDGIRIVNSPKLALPDKINEDLMTDLNVDYDTKHEVILKSELALAPITTRKPIEFQLTTTQKSLVDETAITQDINVPEHLKNLMQNMNLESALNPKPPSNEPSLEEQKKMKEMLAAIGVFTTTSSTTTALPNAENVAESLSPDMRDLLMSFGLLANPNSTPSAPLLENSAFLPDKAEVKAESYVGFKPLPEEGPGRQDMDELLASFGLGRSGRKEKSLKNTNNAKKDEKEINLDIVPENFKSIISDMGLTTRQEKKIRSSTKEKTLEKQHVFNPDSQYATEEELKKLDKLIGMVRQLEKMNGTVNEEDLKKLDLSGLSDLVQSLNGYKEPLTTLDELENGPDPNNFDSGLSKNEVKRQKSTERSVSTSISIVEAVTEGSTTPTTIEEPRTPNIKDLEASFGGQSEVSVVTTEAALPETTTARRNGFYYLVDWNTFLDIDDTKGRRVNLRFQPTIGDPKRFLSVSVP